MRPSPTARFSRTCPVATLIGRDLLVQSDISTVGAAVIMGRVSGTIEACWVQVDAGARVDGDIAADNAIIHGEVTGSVRATNLALGPAARVAGDVLVERLHAAPRARVDGRSVPSMRLVSPDVRKALRSVARDPRNADRIDPVILDLLLQDGLTFERGGRVFVSIHGLLELSRQWKRSIGLGPGNTARMHLAAARPLQVAALRQTLGQTEACVSVVADDVQLHSNLATNGHLYLRGNVRGNIRAGELVVGDAARIAGSVRAERVRIAGHVTGAVTADRVLLLTTARVDGEVNFGAMEARGGARYESGRQIPQCRMQMQEAA